MYLEQIKNKIEDLELRNVELRVQIEELKGDVRNLTDSLTREKEIVSEQNKTIKLLKVELGDLLIKTSNCQEELMSLLCERTGLVQSLAETNNNLNHLQGRVRDQEDIILHCRHQLETEKYSKEVLLRKLENYPLDHRSFVNVDLTSKITDERGGFDSESCEEDDLCISLVHKAPQGPPVTMFIFQDSCIAEEQEKHSCLSSVVQIFGCRRGHSDSGRLVMWPHRSPRITSLSVPHLSLATALLSGQRIILL